MSLFMPDYTTNNIRGLQGPLLFLHPTSYMGGPLSFLSQQQLLLVGPNLTYSELEQTSHIDTIAYLFIGGLRQDPLPFLHPTSHLTGLQLLLGQPEPEPVKFLSY